MRSLFAALGLPGSVASARSRAPGDLEQHLLARGIDPDETKVVIDEESGTATFLLYNLGGQLVGFQRYNPKGSKDHPGRRNKGKARHDPKNVGLMRYFTFLGKEGDARTPKLAVWGLESLDDRPFVFVVEGVFDAAKIRNAGLPAVAVLANHPKPLMEWFWTLGKRVIAVVDRDAAGQKLASIADDVAVVPEPYHDLGDMPQDEAARFLVSVLARLGIAAHG